ncbi:serine hydrolase domain-containing protein [Hyphococcus sp.]|jgi:CubicO group peptidase (beta-lactamase class C family)|uniref:serine hydrolase domain-containing protein n=1 Tax=Hyphococcus sp. TaxID=2038636 RepID=UPI003D13E530
MSIRTIGKFAAAFSLAACSAAEQAPSAPSGPDIPALMSAAKVPGLAIAVIDDCKIDDVSYYGVADVETGEAIGPDTIFEGASLTKTIFTVIVNQLADEGVIDLDEPLAASFDYPRVTDQQAYATLTPRIILAHRSGFPNWASDPNDEETWGEIAFKNAPDEKFGYSGEAYQMLQAYVEAKTGESFETLFEERFGAMMPNTFLSAPEEGAALAFAHDDNGGKEKGRPVRPSPRAGAAYSVLTNADDYAAFLVEVHCNGAGMSEEARAEMLRPQSPTDNERISWALGWGVQTGEPEFYFPKLYFHWGDNGQFKVFAAFNSETQDGVVYFANAKNGLKIIEPLAEPVIGDVTPMADWLDYGRLEESAPE